MVNLLDKEYFHLGTDNIKKELWIDLYDDQFHKNNIKPGGGLWCSSQNNALCDWVTYLKVAAGHNYDVIVAGKKCSLIKFKNNIRFLRIENENDLKNLIDSGLLIKLDEPEYVTVYHSKERIDFVLDYDSIKQYYDLIYINEGLSNSFKLYRINTMLALNPNAIEYYKPLDVDLYYETIDKVFDKKYIKEPCEDYYKFLEYLNYLFKTESIDSAETLYRTKEKIIEFVKNDIDKQPFKLEDINKDLLIENNIKNIYFKEKKLLMKK